MIKNHKFEDITCACGCATVFNKYDSKNRIRTYIRGHNPQDYTNVQRNKKIADKLRGNSNGYSYGSVSYGRYTLRRAKEARCEVCSTKETIHIHHKDKKDKNRRNNSLSNLQFLCQIHHVMRHKEIKYGTNTR